MRRLRIAGAALAGLAIAATAAAQQDEHSLHQHDQATAPETSAPGHRTCHSAYRVK